MTHDSGVSRRAVLKRGTMGLAASAIGFSGNAGARGRLKVPDDFGSVQAAVDAASPGDTVYVDGGTYREQVFVGKDLTLVGNGATLEASDSMDSVSIPESAGSTWEPLVFAYGGDLAGGGVSGPGTVDVSVSGFEIDGRSIQPTANRKVGIFYRNASGRVSGNSVSQLGVGGKETMGILAYGDSSVVVESNDVREFERGGIGANGNGGQHPSPSVVVRNNAVDSGSAPGVAWGPNGVQIGYGASGRVAGNTIANCRYAETAASRWFGSGVLIFESDGVQVQRNTLQNNDVAVAVSSWGFFRESADNCKITRNVVRDALIGVNLRARTFGAGDSSVSNSKVVNNDLDGGEIGDTGVLLGVTQADDGYRAEMRNNKVIRNSVTGFETTFTDEGSATKARAFEP